MQSNNAKSKTDLKKRAYLYALAISVLALKGKNNIW